MQVISPMARGFESKSAQDQQLEAENARAERGSKEKLDRHEIERRKERESIQMSLNRVRRELDATTSERRKVQLRAAIEYLESELKKIG